MCKFESQKDESRAQSADSSKAYRKPRAFNSHPMQSHTSIYDIGLVWHEIKNLSAV